MRVIVNLVEVEKGGSCFLIKCFYEVCDFTFVKRGFIMNGIFSSIW